MGERTIPSVNSLVKYDNPVLVTKHAEKKVARKDVSPSRAPAGSSVAADQKKDTEEILNAILPPKEWEENGNLWLQQARVLIFLPYYRRNLYLFISRYPASRQLDWT